MVATALNIKTKKHSTSERLYSVEEYYKLEEKSIYKHQYHSGKIIPIEGASVKHNLLATKISILIGFFLIKNLLKLKISNSDTKVRINSYNKIVYPDAVVICEVPEYFEDRNDTITNPLIVVEISSPSTSKHDRTTKFEMYATIPSFKEYVLIDQDIQRVSVWSKQKDGSWMPKMYLGEDSVIILEAMNNCPISLKDLYGGLE